MNKMREVELQEKIAEQAEEEAVSAGLETLAKVEQLKQMLAHAKEANDMVLHICCHVYAVSFTW